MEVQTTLITDYFIVFPVHKIVTPIADFNNYSPKLQGRSMTTYIKKDVIEKTAEKTGLENKDAAKAVNAVFDSLRELMTDGPLESRIEIRNFGVFEVKKTAAKPKARNPKKPDQVIYIPPRRKTLFRPGKVLKNILRQPLE